MNYNAPKQLQQVCGSLKEAREWLMAPSPANVERCIPCLEAAVDGMRLAESEIGSKSENLPATRTEMESVRRELRTVNALLEQSAAIHRHWADLLGMAAPGYSADGHPTTVEPSAAIGVKG